MAARATVDTRPLFSWLRSVAYTDHQDFDALPAFAEHLTELATTWLNQRARPTSGGPRPTEWAPADLRKVTREAEKIAHWTWERMRNSPEADR